MLMRVPGAWKDLKLKVRSVRQWVRQCGPGVDDGESPFSSPALLSPPPSLPPSLLSVSEDDDTPQRVIIGQISYFYLLRSILLTQADTLIVKSAKGHKAISVISHMELVCMSMRGVVRTNTTCVSPTADWDEKGEMEQAGHRSECDLSADVVSL